MGMGREVETGHALSLRGAVAFEADKRAGLQRMTATAGRGAPVVDSFCSIRLV